jgi:ATP-dependent Zn protease
VQTTLKSLMYWMVAALVIFLFWSVSSRIQRSERRIAFSDFLAQVEQEHVARVTLTAAGGGTEIVGTFKNGQGFRTFAPPEADLLDELMARGVEVSARDATSASWAGHLVSWLPIVIMLAFLVYFMRVLQTANQRRAARVTPLDRREKRLETKSLFFDALVAASDDLGFEELLSSLGVPPATSEDDREARKALYEMLSDGLVLITDRRKYRLRTTP